MNCRHHTLGEEPFNFDITWPFPIDERNKIVKAVKKIDINNPSQISKLDEKLNLQLADKGYIWDSISKTDCSLWKPDFENSVDFYNKEKKIAIEVEKTEVKRIIHDFLKLVNGSLTFVPKIRYGVIILPDKYKRTSGKVSPFSSRVYREINFYFNQLILHSKLNDVLFIIYDFDD